MLHIMGLYAKTAYGTPKDVVYGMLPQITKKWYKLRKRNCLHAHKGISLQNNEVFYHKNAMLLNYIVEFVKKNFRSLFFYA